MLNGKLNEQAKNQALRLYERACQKSWWATVRAVFTGYRQRLLDMEQLYETCTIVSDRYVGVQGVPIAQIRGSVNVGRVYDFDADFRPIKTYNKERWLGLAAARQRGVKVPPVLLVKIGEIYFVEDGHHRISVARAMDQTEIQAEVTIWQVAGPLPWEAPAKSHRVGYKPNPEPEIQN